ncbi:hypothetical protein OAS42_00480 [bacterium]|jgi:hypothetical protein|nr:hypothetical protein [bacterium]
MKRPTKNFDDYVKVQDEPDLVRDPESGAIININRSSIQKAKDAKKKRLAKQSEEDKLRNKVDVLESDISDIKSLLSQLVEKL